MSLDRNLQRVWYERRPVALFLLLLPLSALFALLSGARRVAFRLGVIRSVRLPCPVIVVGNVSVGGTGKTPLVIWIADYLASRGCRVGIVTRGYGGSAQHWPQEVSPQASPEQVGDEAVLLASRANAIVVAGRDRVEAGRRAIAQGAQIIVSDDGLQHYRLQRDAEIVVIDAQRRFGNGWLLPAGPLREPESRARSADLIVETVRNQATHSRNGIKARHSLGEAINLVTGERRSLAQFSGLKVHAVAGIGNPDAFFAMLGAHGLIIDAHAFPDHAPLAVSDTTFADEAPVLMTEKDAVKCRAFASERHWSVPLAVTLSTADELRMKALLDRLVAQSNSSDGG